MSNLDNNNIELQDDSFHFFKKVSDKDKYNFYEYLSVMLNAGVGMRDALSGSIEKLDNVYFKQKISEIIVFISSGDSFSKAMKKNPQIFSKHEISIVESGETTGSLDKSLSSLAISIKKVDALKKKVKTSLTYPLILFIFLILAVLIVLTYVIPALMPLFVDSEIELPFATKALISTSDFVKNNWIILVFGLISFSLFIIGYKSTDVGKARIDNIILSFPLIGVVYRNYIIANISYTMGNLIGSGVSTLKVLKLVGKSSGSFIYEKLFDEVLSKVETGNKIVDSMREVDKEHFYFPNSYLQMLSVGEKTANLKEINDKISEQYTREVDYSLANLTKWIEPIAILFAAGFVLWFAFAVFGAILQITQSVGG